MPEIFTYPVWGSVTILHLVMPIAIGCFCLAMRGRRSPETVQGIATLLGIGGTFLGIIIALSGIDFRNFVASVPDLLNGIYPAFFSSLTGVGVSVWVYVHPSFWGQRKEFVEDERDIDFQMLQEMKNLNETIALKIDGMKESFDAFAEKMSENNIKALEEVVRDFNTKLQEQFGENFKQLNEAVGKLLTWQENYSETIETNQSELGRVLETLLSSRESMEVSAGAMEKIAESADSLKENAAALNIQLGELRDTTGAISEFARQLDGAPERIEGSMNRITKESLESLGQNLKAISEALVQDWKQVQQIIEMARSTANQSSDSRRV